MDEEVLPICADCCVTASDFICTFESSPAIHWTLQFGVLTPCRSCANRSVFLTHRVVMFKPTIQVNSLLAKNYLLFWIWTLLMAVLISYIYEMIWLLLNGLILLWYSEYFHLIVPSTGYGVFFFYTSDFFFYKYIYPSY